MIATLGTEGMQQQRRKLLIGGISGLVGLTGMGRAAASLNAPTSSLAFYNIHTAEALSITYRMQGAIVATALERINRLLRDFRSGESMAIDIDLLDTLDRLYERFGRRGRFEVISGYRSPSTNAALRRVTSGVALHSYHMLGRAIDIRLIGTPTDRLRDAALELGRGGVGYYPDSNFVHLDTGAVRRW